MFRFFKKNNTEVKKLWQQFKGKKNTENVLFEKAKSLSPIIIAFSVEGPRDLRKYNELKQVVDRKFQEVSSEMIPFYIHCADRVAFQYLDPEQRKKFIVALFTAIRQELAAGCENKDDAIQLYKNFTDTYFDRQEEYSKYKMSADKNEGYRDYLFWEFSRKCANILGDENDPRVITYILATVTSSLSAFQLPEFFQE